MQSNSLGPSAQENALLKALGNFLSSTVISPSTVFCSVTKAELVVGKCCYLNISKRNWKLTKYSKSTHRMPFRVSCSQLSNNKD
jgi:hypothetical protein